MPPSISRRNALRSFAGAAALAAVTRSASSAVAQTPAAPTMPASPNPIRHSVCKWCFGKIPLEAFAKAVKEFGIESVELLDPKDWPTVQKLGLTCALATGTTTIPVGFNRIENHAKYVASMTERINAVADAGLPSVIVFSGNRTDKAGVTVSDEQGIENCAIGLKQIMGVAEKRGVTVIMELLNSKVNHKD
jgi:hydroxypyruvate isomerase